jgi:hypothetical protein
MNSVVISPYWEKTNGQWWYCHPRNDTRVGGTKRVRGFERKCVNCGVVFPARKVRGRNKAKYCSRRCFQEDQPIGQGPLNPRWKGGREIDRDGYVRLWRTKEHPRVLEHRLVMEQHLGRSLRKGETVHHINGDKQDNRIENLQLRFGTHGPHQAFCCGDCGSHNLVPTQLF